jgi:cell division protein FtsW
MPSKTQRPSRNLTRHEQLAKGPIDLPFLMLVLLLLGIGLIMLLSASSYSSLYDTAAGYNASEGIMGDPYYYFKRQAVFAVIGVGAMLLISRLDYQYLRLWSVPILAVAVILLVLVLIPGIGIRSHNARRWLKLLLVAGPQFQPSEIAKLGVVMFFSARLSKRRQGRPRFDNRLPQPFEGFRYFAYKSDLVELIPYGVILLVILALMMKEPHMSGALLVMAAGAAILFAAGIHLGWFVVGGGLIAVVGYLAVFVLGYNSSRIGVWQDPWSDATDAGYQTVQSLYAVASGGLTGLGFGLSRQKYLYLPEEQNDLIFAVVCEELGFIGAALIIILFALLVIRGYWLAIHSRDRFGSLLIIGFTTLLAVQVFLNMAVVLNIIPVTGISLPFFSYGGTALLIQLLEMGIILSVSRQIAPHREGSKQNKDNIENQMENQTL